jgi:glutathione reductase (NADPH)
MPDSEFDLIVVGTGPAASTIASKCAAAKWKVAVVESRDFGGTCALRGCNPKKVYTNAAELAEQARGARGKLARHDDFRIHWPDLLKFKREFTEPVRESTEAGLNEQGIATFPGTARFVDPETIAVGNDRLRGGKVALCVGARPAPLGIEGERHLLLSDDFLELEQLPRRTAFLGGGYVSFEFAHVAARAGARVTILESGERPLDRFDPDLVGRLVDHSRKVGIEIETGQQVTAIEKLANGEFAIAMKSSRRKLAVDAVIHGGGRVPNLEDLDLPAGNVACGKGGIFVNQHLQSTSNPNVYAAGDCADTSAPPLTPSANEEARVVVKNLLDGENRHVPDYGCVPSAVFSVPALAMVGLTEEQAREQGFEIEARFEDMSSWGSVRKLGCSCAASKVLIEKSTDRILGAHLLGPRAEETINLFAMAMKFNITAKELKSVLFVFPTFAHDVRSLL